MSKKWTFPSFFLHFFTSLDFLCLLWYCQEKHCHLVWQKFSSNLEIFGKSKDKDLLSCRLASKYWKGKSLTSPIGGRVTCKVSLQWSTCVGEFKNELSTGNTFVLSHRNFSHTFSTFHRREDSYLWVAKIEWTICKEQKDAVNAKFLWIYLCPRDNHCVCVFLCTLVALLVLFSLHGS